MKINFKQSIKNINGVVIKDETSKEEVTLKIIAINALMASFEEDRAITGVEKAKRYNLAMNINNDKEEYTVEEISLVKDMVGKGYGPLIVGRAYEMLEGNTME